MPTRPGSTRRRTSASAGSITASAAIWPSSMPTLNANSDTSRCVPANWKFSLRPVREPEAVHQAEQPGDQDAALDLDADDVLERHVDDRRGDRRLDERREPGAAGREVERRAEQRERVRDREHRDHRQDLPPSAQRDHQAEQEQEVVVAGQDVRDAEPDEAARGVQPARVQRHRPGAAA